MRHTEIRTCCNNSHLEEVLVVSLLQPMVDRTTICLPNNNNLHILPRGSLMCNSYLDNNRLLYDHP